MTFRSVLGSPHYFVEKNRRNWIFRSDEEVA